ncbi:MAG TPA: DUF4743 domain-containing protein [Alphaproteobacteria bacterium]|nr:DUF4743 domain-containing protein [Alphaproteobacteria bacterium]
MSTGRLLRHVEACNRFDPTAYRPFAISGDPIGHVTPEAAKHLLGKGLAHAVGDGVGILGGGFLTVSNRLAEIVDSLIEAGLMAGLKGEMTPVHRRWGTPPIAEIDRAGLPALGLPAYGVHVNGLLRTEAGLHLWVGRRARDRRVAPGKLDHLIAGGIPSGLSVEETLVKEGQEEAGLDAGQAARARPTGVVSYRFTSNEGLRNDILFVHDLEMPQGVIPAPFDGEVERFELWSIARVLDTVRGTDDFKFNVNLVLIDFFIRHGILTPENEPDYTALARGLRH